MNKTVTYILVGGASALFGAVAGYIFCKKRLSNFVEDAVNTRVNEELSKIRERNESKTIGMVVTEEISKGIKDGCEHPDEAIQEGFNRIFKELVEEQPHIENPYREAVLHLTRPDSAVYPGYDDEEAEEEDEVEPDDPQMAANEWNGRLEIVHIDDYKALPTIFDFVTYHYFEDDDTLIDDQEEIIDDIDRLVGDALLHFGECDENDDDTVYVVNGDYGLAIEIVRMHSDYATWTGWGG